MTSQRISGTTQLLGVYAYPIKHSLSPFIQNRALELCDIDARYLAFDIKNEDFEHAMLSIKALNMKGINLSMPYKKTGVAFMDDLSPEAAYIGAINTCVNTCGKLRGYNTDGIGFVNSLKERQFELLNKKVTLLGAGGAAKAIAYQLCQEEIREICIFKRENNTFQDTLYYFDKMSQDFNKVIKVIPYEDSNQMDKELRDSDMVVNCTSLGMERTKQSLPVKSMTPFHNGQLVIDLIYQPEETLFLIEAKKANCQVMNGLAMLIHQASEAFYLWTDKQMPVAVITQELKSVLYEKRSTK